MVTEPVDVQYVFTTIDDRSITVLRSQDTVTILPEAGRRLPHTLVLAPGQAFQFGRALVELGFFGEDGA